MNQVSPALLGKLVSLEQPVHLEVQRVTRESLEKLANEANPAKMVTLVPLDSPVVRENSVDLACLAETERGVTKGTVVFQDRQEW